MLLVVLESYEKHKVEEALELIFSEAAGRGLSLRGPILFPTLIRRFTVLRSPHIDKKSREQFEIRKTRRGLVLVNAGSADRTWLQALVKRLPYGLALKIKNRQAHIPVE